MAHHGSGTLISKNFIAMADGPLFVYRKLVGLGDFKLDPGQELLAEKLQNLHHSLKDYEPDSGQGGWRERLGLASRRTDPLKGLYIYGGVGAGKSMLMDLFFDGAPVVHKRRVHFHDFLQDVHDRFNVLRKSKIADLRDPIPIGAENLANELSISSFPDQVSPG